ncbi:MAG: hypothetical protein CMB82_02790 [Flammeovirgaceae bacterium]|nr:hypothetical protein [Flammeovirgaceae bacterium]|tara:strand:+ start:2166 stop:2759 length:594 start_codon:yes stop_codon:yes gene_type:complete
MKKHRISISILAIIFSISCSLKENKEQKNLEFNDLDKSSMDMIYYPDGFAYKKTFKGLPGDSIVARIIYGRPKKNNRKVFEEIIPYGKVWRTGANEATEFTAYKDLIFYKDTLSAGTYTLYTIPEEDQWTIIFSNHLYVWGAYKYNSKNDVLRITQKVEPSSEIVEIFSMRFEKTDNNKALLKLAWDQTKVEIPFNH